MGVILVSRLYGGKVLREPQVIGRDRMVQSGE